MLEEGCCTRMYTLAALVVLEQAICAVMLVVLVVQHPGVPAADIEGDPLVHDEMVVVPSAQMTKMHTSRPAASIVAVGSAVQVSVEVPVYSYQSTSAVPEETAVSVEPLVSHSSIDPRGYAVTSVSLGSYMSPEHTSDPPS